MKIGLITIHYANSYGGILQAFSTQKVLSKYGDVSIIDYKSPHLYKTMKLIRIGRNPRSVLWAGKDIFRLLPRYRLIKKFKSFGREHFKLSKAFTNIDEMANLEEHFDIFVIGSDQIWNPAVVGEMDPAYLLSFVKEKKKISFSSSAGSHRFSEEEKVVLKKNLETFSHLSVREIDMAIFLSKLLGDRPVSHVLDPTLMLTKQEWLDNFGLETPQNETKYILVYTLKKDRLVREVVKKVVQRLAVKVVAIDQDPFLGYPVDKHLMDANPRDFIELISGAAFIVTNSFHGTTFAVNFGVPFLSVKRETGLNRIEGFLQSLGLSERLVEKYEDVVRILDTTLLYKDALGKLNDRRKTSQAYLETALHNKVG